MQLPITSDYRMAQAFAKRISPSLVSEQGTAIGRALEQAMLSFSSQSEQSRVIILITDGENHEDDAVEAARKAAEQGIRIYTIGIGTPEGAPIQIGGEFIKDENGEMVVSKLNEQMLEHLHIHGAERVGDLGGRLNILCGRDKRTIGMVVREDNARHARAQRLFDQLACVKLHAVD